jgi:protein involved in polysaccharide export with SLBB domain
VQGEAALSDTFALDEQLALTLPAPAVGALSLRGVLRSEVDSTVRAFVSRFKRDPVVRARALLRIGITGEVSRAGYFAVPADMRLTDLLMVASGTTRDADLARMSISRGGRERIADRRLRDAMTRGWTIDDAGMQDGDVLRVARGDVGFEQKLRFVWVLVSVAGGIYGLTRAF